MADAVVGMREKIVVSHLQFICAVPYGYLTACDFLDIQIPLAELALSFRRID